MELRRLRYFVVVAEELNFSRAAERLRLAQPALSQQVRHLEKELGVELFDRTRRNIRLTEAGQLLLEEVRLVFVQLDQIVARVRRVGLGEVGGIDLGFVASAANSVLPHFLREFRRRFPDVQLFLKEMTPDEQMRGLHDKRIDVGFMYLPVDDAALDLKPVLREPFVVALPETHPLATEPQVETRKLAAEPFIMHPRQHAVLGLYGLTMEVCRQAGFTPKVVQEGVWLTQTIVGLVAGEIGVALVPASLQNLPRTGVVYKTLREPSAEVEMGVVWRSYDVSPVLRAFLGVVSESPIQKVIQEEADVRDAGPAQLRPRADQSLDG